MMPAWKVCERPPAGWKHRYVYETPWLPSKSFYPFLRHRVRWTSYLFFRLIDLLSGQNPSEMLVMKLKPAIVFGSVCTTPIIAHRLSPVMGSVNILILLACVGLLHGIWPRPTLQNLFLIFAILSSRVFDL